MCLRHLWWDRGSWCNIKSENEVINHQYWSFQGQSAQRDKKKINKGAPNEVFRVFSCSLHFVLFFLLS